MGEAFDSIAYGAVNDAALYMTSRAPGMSEFYRIMGKRQSDEPNVTVRVVMENGHPVMEYGVEFVRTIEKSLLGSIMYMQCMKVALHHCDKRKRSPTDVYKLASDLVVAEYGKNLVDCSVPGNIDIVRRLYPTVWSYWDMFRKYDFGMGTDLYLEKVFDIFMQEMDDQGDGSDGDNGPDDDDSGPESDDADGEGSTGAPDDDDEPGEGDAESDGSDGNSPSEGDGKPGDPDGSQSSFDAMNRYFSTENAETDLEGWSKDELSSANIQAAAIRADQSGALDRMPGSLPIMIAEANRIKVNVESLFRHFVDSVEDEDYELTWNRRDRRLPRTEYITVPGKIVGRTHRILLAVDLSGSMYFMGMIPDCIRLMGGIVNGLSVDVCYWDAVCSEIYQTPKSMSEISLSGGGSTNPQCVLDRVRESREMYDGIVFLTDCEFEWACPPHPREIMIIQAGHRVPPPDWCMHHVMLADLLKER